jgi:glycine/D-amino acid oxidase-like deaminating enzyme
MAEPSSRGEVVIVGGGVAALEILMALHELAAAAVRVTLVAAGPAAEPGPAPEASSYIEVPLEAAQAAPVGG